MNRALDIELINNDSSSFKDYFLDKLNNESIRFLPKVNNINLFIGANNSGKSRFLRELMTPLSHIGIKDSAHLFSNIDTFNLLLNDFQHVVQVHDLGIKYLIELNNQNLIEKELDFNQSQVFGFTTINKNESLDLLIQKINNNLLISDKLNNVFTAGNMLYGRSRDQYIRSITFNKIQVNESVFLVT